MAVETEFFSCPRAYFQSATSLEDRICKIDAIIAATLDAMLLAASGTDTTEYRLDDGQTRINVTSRSMNQMADSITALRRVKNQYIALYNGSSTHLLDRDSQIAV